MIVTVNGVKSVCAEDCSYSFISTTPKVTSQTKDATGVTITVAISDPANANYPTSQLTVKVDGQPCTIASGAFASFTCTLPTNSNNSPKVRAGNHDVEVFVAGSGVVGIDAGVAKLFYDLTLSSLSSSSGGINGGYPIIISGAGFPSDVSQAAVTLCGKNALVTSTNNIATTITVPSCTAGSQDITYTYNGISKTISFSYNTPTITQTITSITPQSFSPVQKGVMTITGSGFGTVLADITVYLANASGKVYRMRVLSVNDTIITCGIPGGLAGNYKVEVSIAGVGDIPPASPTVNDFKYELLITSISPTSGPYYGGTLVTITGVNFSPDLLENLVSIGNELDWLCSI